MYGYEIFHEDVLKELIKSVQENTARHAYLFTGPEGVGKMRAAKLFANALVCTSTNVAPCTSCGACTRAKSDNNPDIIYVKPDEKKSVTTKQARQIVADAHIKPFESTRKVYIFEDASLLNEATQNCLLKILEEPPEYITFIILTTGEDMLLQTVLSRCTVIDFPPVEDKIVLEYINKNYPEAHIEKDVLISLCQGVCGEVDKILNDADYDIIRNEALKMLAPLLSAHKISAYKVCSFLEDYKERLEMIFDFWQSFLRDIIMIKNSMKKYIINKDLENELEKIAYNVSDICPVIASEEITTAKTMAKRYVNIHALGLRLSFVIKKRLHG